jgi:hypothetical protein
MELMFFLYFLTILQFIQDFYYFTDNKIKGINEFILIQFFIKIKKKLELLSFLGNFMAYFK